MATAQVDHVLEVHTAELLEEQTPTENSPESLGYETNAIVEQVQQAEFSRFDMICKCTFLISLLVVAGLVTVGVLISKSKETSLDDDTPDLSQMAEYFDYLFQVLSPHVETLNDPTSPTYEALQWMAFEDEMILQEMPEIRQRYALLVLYFATGGIDFWGSEWLRPGVSECEFQGVACNNEEANVVTDLELYHRQLIGELPSEITWLTSLQVLNLRHNRLHGSLPPTIFTELTNLQYLELSFNELSGPLPGDWSALTQLEAFSARSNVLTGPLPTYWPTTLEYFTVTLNFLSGELPLELFQVGNNLQLVDIGDTLISGTIPPVIGHWTHLKSLGLYQTKLGGQLPSELGLLPIEELSLGRTKLYGTVPKEVYQMSTLQWMVATDTLLEGTLSSEIGQMSNLAVLNFVHTRISGTIPTELGLLSKLEWLQLSHTEIEGTIPTELSELSLLSK
jgi:Leucine-rich repeat (LRR) protein